MNLFRKEAINNRANRLYGTVMLTTSMSSWVIVGFLTTIVFGIGVVLTVGTHARKETVSGWLRPDKGLVRVVAPQAGVIEATHVLVGDTVKANTPLITLQLDTGLSDGRKAVDAGLEALNFELKEQENQAALIKQRFQQDRARTINQQNNAAAELEQLRRQLSIQDERVKVAQTLFKTYESLLAEDASSSLELDNQRESFLALRQSHQQLGQQIIVKSGEIANYSAELQALPVNEETELSRTRESISALKRQKTQLERQGKVVLISSLPGRVAALPVRKGEFVKAQELQIAILPEGGQLEVELFIPTRAAGFIRVGQSVRVRLDAFPYQKFGIVAGEIMTISKTVFNPDEVPGAVRVEEPVYRINASIDRQGVNAYGEDFPLQAGMKVQADIIQKKQKIWEILFESFRR